MFEIKRDGYTIEITTDELEIPTAIPGFQNIELQIKINGIPYHLIPDCVPDSVAKALAVADYIYQRARANEVADWQFLVPTIELILADYLKNRKELTTRSKLYPPKVRRIKNSECSSGD